MIVWSESCNPPDPKPLPFLLDLNSSTIEHIERLLAVCGSEDGEDPLGQEKEAIAVAALNLLTLQLHTVFKHGIQIPGLESGTK